MPEILGHCWNRDIGTKPPRLILRVIRLRESQAQQSANAIVTRLDKAGARISAHHNSQKFFCVNKGANIALCFEFQII